MLVIDTDIGDDIDDAFAIAWALSSTTVEVKAIVTTFGNTPLRAKLVRRMLDRMACKDVAVGVGIESRPAAVFTQATWAQDGPEPGDIDGIALTLELASRHPGKITLVALGPLGNIRTMIERDAGAFQQIDRVVMMGGSIRRGYNDRDGNPSYTPQPEHNVANDPAGLRALLDSGVPVTMMPLDCTQLRPGATSLRQALRGNDALADLTAEWISGNSWGLKRPTLYDVVAMAAVIAPDMCPLQPLRIAVRDDGLTVEENGPANLMICLVANHEGVMKAMAGDLIQPSRSLLTPLR